MDLNAREKITKARVQLLSQNPFFAYLVLNLNVQEDNNMPMPTACVDAFGNLYYDKKFIESLPQEQCKTLLIHEVLHISFEHLLRLKHRERDIWNIAVDICVNNIIVNNGFPMIKGCIIPNNNEIDIGNIHITDIDKKTAEEIYEELKPLVNQKQALMDILKQILDTHKFPSKEEIESKLGKENTKRWKELLVGAVEYAKERGTIPKGMERYVDKIHDEKINWRHILYKYIVREIPQDYSYSLPSRKSISAGYFVPSVKKENIDIVVSVDTSGSINQTELTDFLSEIIGIAKGFNNIKITCIVCDAKVHEVMEISNGNIENILNLKMKGGGGTSHRPVISYIEDNIPKCKIYIGLTDGHSDIQNLKEPYFNVLWVISKNGVKKEFQFGETIFLED